MKWMDSREIVTLTLLEVEMSGLPYRRSIMEATDAESHPLKTHLVTHPACDTIVLEYERV